ncbi:MAG: hypothetical protein Q4G49_08490 [Paracoccus sp. (in: a-proteobacteria)]|nr:hypothetical protein [Paracoccus sp. (in: a-proteobacteria)]
MTNRALQGAGTICPVMKPLLPPPGYPLWTGLVDLFLIPGMIAEDKSRLRNNLREEMALMAGTRAGGAVA